MKQVDKLLLRSFIGPFVITFFIALFVLVMQFLWKYIDDLVGKGLELSIIAELIFYASAGLVPLALPLSILLSSIMTFGNLGEHYELVALKSAGVSLIRIMASLIILVIFLSFVAFWFSNYMLPKANLKYGVLLYDVTHKRPAFDIQPGIFYNGIDGFSIRAKGKGEDSRTLFDVLIYDHTKGKGNTNVIVAEKAEMYPDPNGNFLTFKLYNGYQYEEMQSKPKPRLDEDFEHTRTGFKLYNKVFDMSGFAMKNTSEDLFKKNYQMLNVFQLQYAIDSLDKEIDKRIVTMRKHVNPYISIINDTVRMAKLDSLRKLNRLNSVDDGAILASLPADKRKDVLQRATSIARNVKGFSNVAKRDISIKEKSQNKFTMEWHRKIVLSFACIVLFFVGAPLGAITKKGGLGLPMVLAIIFFIIYHLLSTVGKKLAEEFILSPFAGMWLATLILTPFGIFLTQKALNDRSIVNIDQYISFFTNIFKKLGFGKSV